MKSVNMQQSYIGYSFIFCCLFIIGLAQASIEKYQQFSSAQAYQHCVNILKFGPRVSDSPGIIQTQNYIKTQLAQYGWQVHEQRFKSSTPIGGITFTNLIAYYAPNNQAIQSDFKLANKLISCHYDSKYLPKSKKPFLGANDSAASIGIMLEMAKLLAQVSPELAKSTNFVFFDGEEAFGSRMHYKNYDHKDGLYGSSYFAKTYQADFKTQPTYLINLDLIGDSNYKVLLSKTADAKLKETAWNLYKENKKQDYSFNLSKAKLNILDDHIPLHQAGAKVLNIIGDFQKMSYWHHHEDDINNISATQLKAIGVFTLDLLHHL